MKHKTLIFFLGLAVSLFVGEIGIRIFRGELFTTSNLIVRRLFKKNGVLNGLILSERLGWTLPDKPMRVSRMNWVRSLFGELELGRPYVVNSAAGVRVTPNVFSSRLNNDQLIVTLGDSFTFGGEVSDEETWPFYIQAITNNQVLNGGLTLYGLDQSFLKLQQLLNNHRPKTVILSIMEQSILRTQRKSERWSITANWVNRPYFSAKNGKLELNNISNNLMSQAQHQGSPPLRIEGSRFWLGKSHLADFIFGRIAFDWWFGRSWGREIPAELLTNQDPGEISCLLLKSYRELSMKRNFRLIVVGQYYWQDPYKTYKSEVMTSKVLHCARGFGILTVDLESKLRELSQSAPEEYNTLYFPGAHMTNRGNLWVAQEISKYL